MNMWPRISTHKEGGGSALSTQAFGRLTSSAHHTTSSQSTMSQPNNGGAVHSPAVYRTMAQMVDIQRKLSIALGIFCLFTILLRGYVKLGVLKAIQTDDYVVLLSFVCGTPSLSGGILADTRRSSLSLSSSSTSLSPTPATRSDSESPELQIEWPRRLDSCVTSFGAGLEG